MITPEEIVAKARRFYPQMQQAWLANALETQFPLLIRSNKGSLATDPAQRTQQLQALRTGSREGRGFGYAVHWQTVRSARYGEQGTPTQISIDTLADYLRLCGLAADFACFREQAGLMQSQLPALAGWLAAHVGQVTPYAGQWPALLRVCAYFQQHPLPGLYARQLPGVHSKFVEQHAGILSSLLGYLLPPEHQRESADFSIRFGLRTDAATIRFRLLDEGLAARFSGLSDLTIPLPDFEQLDLTAVVGLKVLVVENKLTFLALPPLPATLAIWGSGHAVERLKQCAWLHDLPLWYWGDVDLHGFSILTRFRKHFPQVRSVLMDEATYARHQQYAHAGTLAPPILPDLLTPNEQALYQQLLNSATQNRLEQEHIADEYVKEILRMKIR